MFYTCQNSFSTLLSMCFIMSSNESLKHVFIKTNNPLNNITNIVLFSIALEYVQLFFNQGFYNISCQKYFCDVICHMKVQVHELNILKMLKCRYRRYFKCKGRIIIFILMTNTICISRMHLRILTCQNIEIFQEKSISFYIKVCNVY